MKIANKISLSLTLTGAILALIAVSIIYIAVKNNLEKEILQHLITAAQSRANHIETFFDDHKDAVEIMSSEPSFIEVLSMSKNNPEYDKKLETVSNRIKTLINVHKEIIQVNLLDKNGVVVVSTDEASVGFDRSADVTYLKAKEATYVRDINISEAAGIPVIGIATPVLFNREFLGVIIADFKAEELYKITLDRTGLGETGEIYLVNRDFYMISPSRFKEDVILKQKVDTVNARRFLKSANKNYIDELEKINVFPDYRGVNVLGTHAHIHEMQWGLLAEIDENEAYAPLKQITSIFVAILIVIPIAGWLASIFFARLITRPLHRLHKGTEIIGKGNLEYKVGTDSKDEIGQLSRAFDKMTEDLKKTTASMIDLNREIDERKQAEESLRKSEGVLKESKKELSIRNRVAEIFIKVPDDKMYFEVLQVVLETMESPYGTFAYINENGDRVVPTLTRDIWVDCEVQDADIVFPRERWSGIWGRCLINKETVSSSGPFRVPEGHVPITKSMAVPIIYQGEAIGNFMVANKTTDYGEKDKELLETIADYMAPILRVRLQRDRQEEKRKQAEEALQNRTYDLNERVKELNCLYNIANLVATPDITLEAIFQGVVEIIPPSWQYPEITCSRIILEGNEYKTKRFEETYWKQPRDIFVHGEQVGTVEVYYLEEKPEIFEGPFLKEERNLINGIAERLGRIIERKQAEEKIKASLKEKEVLLREIHHRVKNNMQLIISLLRLQADKIEDKKYADMFKESEDRIRSMSLIHEKLYQTKDFANIDFGAHVKSIVDGLFVSHGVDTSKVKLNIDIKDVSFDLENAIPCGLIINELVSNSLKHAFPQKREGEINVALHSIAEDEFELAVNDDGIGIPENFDIEQTDTMGLSLVSILTEHQLGGKIDFDRTEGTQFNIKFKRTTYKPRI